MSKRIFSKEQIETLLKNPNVSRCSEKSISYHKEFKISAVRQYHDGLPPTEIFRRAGFDINVTRKKLPKDCLLRWKRIFKKRGESGLRIDNRGKSGGKEKNVDNLTDKEKLKYLETEVAYLREENRFLAKLRKKSLN